MKRFGFFALLLAAVIVVPSVVDARTATYTLQPGWNLVGGEVLLRSSGFFDKYLTYYYDPLAKKYQKFDGSGDSAYRAFEEGYFNQYLNKDAMASFWIYNDGAATSMPLELDSSMLRRDELSFVKLKQGWNLISIVNAMYYDDNSQPNNLSPEKIKGTCEIERGYIYNAADGSWVSWGSEAASFDDDTIGMGWAVKVAADCQLSSGKKAMLPVPALPQN